MADYFAMIRKIGELLPRRCVFEAADTSGAAINEMERRSGVRTSDMIEFELMKIVDNGKGYIPIAAKRPPKGEKQTTIITADDDPVDETPSVSNVSSVSADEKPYSPYQLAVA